MPDEKNLFEDDPVFKVTEAQKKKPLADRMRPSNLEEFFGQDHLVVNHIEMADRGMNIDRFNRIPAGKMDAVEILGEFQKISALFAGPDGLAGFHIPVIRWR